jgi:hypothetical protein
MAVDPDGHLIARIYPWPRDGNFSVTESPMLTANSDTLTVQKLTGTDAQLWRFEVGNPTSFSYPYLEILEKKGSSYFLKTEIVRCGARAWISDDDGNYFGKIFSDSASSSIGCAKNAYFRISTPDLTTRVYITYYNVPTANSIYPKECSTNRFCPCELNIGVNDGDFEDAPLRITGDIMHILTPIYGSILYTLRSGLFCPSYINTFTIFTDLYFINDSECKIKIVGSANRIDYDPWIGTQTYDEKDRPIFDGAFVDSLEDARVFTIDFGATFCRENPVYTPEC